MSGAPFDEALRAGWHAVLFSLWGRLERGEDPGALVVVVVDDSMPWPEEVRGARIMTRPEVQRVLAKLAELYPDNAPELLAGAAALDAPAPAGMAWAFIVVAGAFSLRTFDPTAQHLPVLA